MFTAARPSADSKAGKPARRSIADSFLGEGVDTTLFELLDPEGQERVTLMKTRYVQLSTLERAAFLQEMDLTAESELADEAARRANRGRISKYKSDRQEAVQARDATYVTMRQIGIAAPDEDAVGDDCAAADDVTAAAVVGLPASDLALRRLLTDELFGSGPVPIRRPRESLYDKIGALGGEEEEAERIGRVTAAAAAEAEIRRRSTVAPRAVSQVGAPGQFQYRCTAYQAARLALSLPAHIHINEPHTKTTTTANVGALNGGSETRSVNVTGMPLFEKELRGWFDALDTEGTGTLGVAEFTACMRELERDYGVADASAKLEAAGQQLALNGRLSFEAFAFLVLRFARE